ncbi:scopoletin glucosyltransferase-like [Senna tora]|uniref:Scopoletin glucosyltransferase-like n=1 Tax=Senna tora TaxID=362788 RepID=A0A834SZN2_9FABA|nr:scopoletin glucosyltransferase-like [Senna tora]
MASENHKLHIFFFPFLAHGHIIPTIDIAKLFASRGIKITIVTTPLNLPLLTTSLETHKSHGHIITIKTIPFPSEEAGLPQGCENADTIPSPSLFYAFFNATKLLQQPLEQLLLEDRPNCLIAGSFYPWATDSAAKFGIPRIVFHGTGSFAMCASESLNLYQPYKNVSSDSEPFVIPNLPGEIKMTRMAFPEYVKSDDDNELTRVLKESREAELRSYGVVVNSFYELDQVYADHYSNVMGRKTWHVGPVSLSNRDMKKKANRGKEASIDEEECLKWLDSKKPNSVLYLCFGSIVTFNESQLKEIALALEASGQNFIWVVRRSKQEDDEWLPEGFEKRMEGKGLIIRGWAPQVLILDHEAVGGFVTHCGWNSTLEGISAGVAMVTWPVGAEQFYNEKFVTEVLGVGVPVGVKKWVRVVGDSVNKEAIEKAVRRIMEEEMRNKVKEFAKMAKEAVEEGGSSYLNLSALIHELQSRCH